MDAAHVVHRSGALAPRDLFAQIGQADNGAEPVHQFLLPVLAGTPALLACEPNEVAGMLGEGE